MAAEILGKTWNLTQQGLEIITNGNTIKDKQSIFKNALDTDLKEIGAPVISKESCKSALNQIVLQIQKVRNISAPKANENSQGAPRMLKLVLTDGDTYIQAIEIDPVSSISLDKTPPGSKLLIQSAPISSGYLLLNSKNCTYLGGKVPSLYEKWEVAKSVYNHNRNNRSTTEGAPIWVNFGSKSNRQQDSTDNNFKSLVENKTKDKENSDFELQRQGAIAEATTGAVKKVFGGGTKQNVANFNQTTSKKNGIQKESVNSRNDRKKFTKNTFDNAEIDDKPQKPLERVSLFDFLEDKLPTNQSSAVPASAHAPRRHNNESKPSQNDYYQPQNNYRGRNTKPSFQKYEQSPRNNYQKYENKSKPYENNNKSYNNQPEKSRNSKYQQHQSKEDWRKPYNNHEFSKKREPPPPQAPERSEFGEISGNMEKLSINSEFASRTLRQHLNLGNTNKKTELKSQTSSKNWKIGDECMAKYWEDNKHYRGVITGVTDKTCVVTFKGYNNIEEVLKTDCFPPADFNKPQGTMEFRRKPYMKQ